jgi:hypothetical protein
VWRIGAIALALAACGDNINGPQPLREDPAVQTGCVPGPVPAGTTRAKRVACAEELIGGRLASGRIGDFLLENERVRVIVRGAGEGYYLFGSSGGGIVDAAVVGGEDLVKEILPSVDLAVGAFDELVITEAGDDGPAELVVRGPATALDIITAALGRTPPPVLIEHHYKLAAGATALELDTQVFAQSALDQAPSLYDAVFLSGHTQMFLAGQGYAMTGQGQAPIVAASGTTTSYAFVYADQDAQLIDLAGIQLVEGPTLEPRQMQRRWLVLGDGSISSVTDSAWALRGAEVEALAGTSAPGVDIEVHSGTAIATIARTDASGAFAANVPPGSYTLRATALGRAPGADVPAQAQTVVPAGPGGHAAISVRDDTGAPIPARVMIENAAGDRRIDWIGATGDGTFAIAPGSYRISVSRGLEYDAFTADPAVIADGQTLSLAVNLAHVVDTSGWLSLDTHLHSELSTDSTFPIDDRLRAVAAEGVEVPVSSDHDVVVDYAPIIAELGLADWLGSMPGEEASSLVWGHLNGWPVVPKPDLAGGGAPHWLGRAPAEIFAALRANDPTRIVQVNHPHYGTTSLFDAIELDPATLTANRDPTELGLPAGTDLSDLSFDAVEVANGLAHDTFEQTFADYLAMVEAGHPAAATGSSDSHGPTAFAGEARTFVWLGPGADDPRHVDPSAITAAIRARHVVVGSGAFVTAGIVTSAGTSLPGDTADVTGLPQVTVHVKIQAAAWQPLAKLRIYERTHELMTIALDPKDTATVRFDADVTLPAPAASTFYVIRVDDSGPGDPVLRTSLPAFTNPLFAHVGP